ncbi:DUF3331 domain-containing protein [Burkholderia pseudomultivorans]|uniref:Ribosomal protein S14 n=1 Tax=Burkholderia pseudomultivorans TaxID=1207504 RepID=A0A6P2JC38_9BURK|nr:DUF3331 domain-containing protein [Burkholderia pseudomultivorans]MDR8726394.1 hypothetical protein [Burkholderia pseudomultivorans]MDR8733618.1 hypothetical protein [Burkholderia pseudomultivorans]MDR8740144.1 hypothetical protein [Burkholderia pseudomultivorans]MDR8752188.1 hypothetical protein [Burkholderia pseudomultivorans]MDR8776583.1 hypothetical protein [Burkholderia pseudomultivorans]
MPNLMERLISEYVSYHLLACDEPDARPSTGTSGMARATADVDRMLLSEHVAPAVSPLRPQLFVTILEAGDDGLLVRWSESGRCHYGEQRWRLRVALQPGHCAISGRPIEPGEPVYRPVRRPVPVNGDEMICPAAVPGATPAARNAEPDAAEAGDPADVLG